MILILFSFRCQNFLLIHSENIHGQPNQLFCFCNTFEPTFCSSRALLNGNLENLPEAKIFLEAALKYTSKEIVNICELMTGPLAARELLHKF